MKFSVGQKVVVVYCERYGRQLKEPEICSAIVEKVGRRWCTVGIEHGRDGSTQRKTNSTSWPIEQSRYRSTQRFDIADARWPLDAGGFVSEGRVYLSEEDFRATHELLRAAERLSKTMQSLRHTSWDAERWATKMSGLLSPDRIRGMAVDLGLGDIYDQCVI